MTEQCALPDSQDVPVNHEASWNAMLDKLDVELCRDYAAAEAKAPWPPPRLDSPWCGASRRGRYRAFRPAMWAR